MHTADDIKAANKPFNEVYNLFNVPCIPHREVDEEGSEEIIQRENLKGREREGEPGR